MYKHAWRTVLIFGFVVLYGVVAVSRYAPHYVTGTTGYDISWPNCHAQVPAKTAFGIIGVTFGRNYTVNPCLSQEVAKFKTYQLYMNTGNVEYDKKHRSATWPKKCYAKDAVCLAYNYGYGASSYALKQASLANIHSPMWWLDIETENTWSTNQKANRAAFEGMVAAISHQTIHTQIGVYSYPGQWAKLMGSYHPDLPAWVATGATDRASALAACKQPSFTNQPVLLTQYTETLDRDYVCRKN